MKILKAFQFKLKPSVVQEQVLRKYMGCARFAYNRALDLQKELYEKEQRKLSYPEMARYLVVWKNQSLSAYYVDMKIMLM